MSADARVPAPPRQCPKCKRIGKDWYSYRITPDTPRCGCGNCGHVVFLTEKIPYASFTVSEDGRMVNTTPARL